MGEAIYLGQGCEEAVEGFPAASDVATDEDDLELDAAQALAAPAPEGRDSGSLAVCVAPFWTEATMADDGKASGSLSGAHRLLKGCGTVSRHWEGRPRSLSRAVRQNSLRRVETASRIEQTDDWQRIAPSARVADGWGNSL